MQGISSSCLLPIISLLRLLRSRPSPSFIVRQVNIALLPDSLERFMHQLFMLWAGCPDESIIGYVQLHARQAREWCQVDDVHVNSFPWCYWKMLVGLVWILNCAMTWQAQCAVHTALASCTEVREWRPTCCHKDSYSPTMWSQCCWGLMPLLAAAAAIFSPCSSVPVTNRTFLPFSLCTHGTNQ